MKTALSLHSRTVLHAAKALTIFLLAVCMLALAGCGSTKVYTADKTMTYRGDLYNMSNVQRISPLIQGETQSGDMIDMKGMDKKAVQKVLDEHSPLMVSMIVEMDAQKMVYRKDKVESYSDFSRMKKSFDSAMSKINKFMANKKSTQLKLK